MIPFIDLKTQQNKIRFQIEERIKKVLDHGQYIMGPEVKELEEKLAEFTGAQHAITCSSGTDALLMVLMALGIGPGDAVFTPPFTFIATAEVIALAGATPVFVDINPRTFNIDPQLLESAIKAVHENDPSIYPMPNINLSSATHSLTPKMIIPVDLFGLPADYSAIVSTAEKNGLFVLADAAQSFGGEYKGSRVGTLGHATATSFFPAKPLGCYGDGGAVFTNDDELAEKLHSIREHGKGVDKYDNVLIGLNARMDTLQAAILLPKLKIFPEELETRQQIAKSYSRQILNLNLGIMGPSIPDGYRSAWAQYSILVSKRQVVREKLKNAGIPSMVYYPKPLHRQPTFKNLGYEPGNFPVSETTAEKILSLPIHPYLKDSVVTKIIRILKQHQ